MTRQRSFKRLVRARMDKTGESYTAARAMLLAAGEPGDEAEPRLATADDAIRERTGRGWEEWFDLLDEWDAPAMKHREIAKRVAAELGIEPLAWNAQAITSSYELTRGLREPGQREDGFAVSVTRTVAVPVERLYDEFVDPDRRAEWLDAGLTERTATRPKSARYDWSDDGTRVNVTFAAKDAGKASISLEHRRLAGAPEAERMKAFWRSALDGLTARLEGGEADA